MEFGLKWVHMAPYELILRLDGALWLRIIFKPLLTPKKVFKITKLPKNLPQKGYLILSSNRIFLGVGCN